MIEILKYASHIGFELGESMFDDSYFFDPIHGLCSCNQIVDRFKKKPIKTKYYSTQICSCINEKIFAGKTILTASSSEMSACYSKWA